jgi:alpha-galactosidase
MVKKTVYLNLIIIIFFLFIVGCEGSGQQDNIQFKMNKNGTVSFRNSEIQLVFDNTLHETVFQGQEVISLTRPDADRPVNYIFLNGKELARFDADLTKAQCLDILTQFGKGKRLVLRGIGNGPENCPVEQTLNIELYENYPNAAVSWAIYRNLGNEELHIDQINSEFHQLDATLAGAAENPWDFWSFQGSSLAWGKDYIFPLKANFFSQNWMGVQSRTKDGGGVPVIDVWTRESGLAIAHLEPKPQLVSLPVKVTPANKVEIAIEKEIDQPIAPGNTFKTLKTAVIVHNGDYFNALRAFSNLMNAQGIHMQEPSPEAYSAIWCGWGYQSDFTVKDILGTIPKLKELGLHWVVIDDRWFDRYGDWNVRKETFPGGEKQMKEFVQTLHEEGFKVKIWWTPTNAQPSGEFGDWPSVTPGAAEVVVQHPDWLVMNKDGSFPTDNRKMYNLCPSVPEVQAYIRQLTVRFIKDWDFDGHKLDAFWTVPPCYNPAHHHTYPGQSHEDLPILLKIIFETTRSLKPNSVTEICNCGTAQDFYQEAYIDQPVTADPISSQQVRRRIKTFKALMGTHAAAYADHVELTRIDTVTWRETGEDFASAVGTGAVVGTKFTWPGGPEDTRLTPDKDNHWKKWISLYNEKMLSKNEYLNLYDIAYDKPETHVIRKGDTLYYAFYADSWNNEVELRGLQKATYKVYDYVNQREMGTLSGPVAKFSPHIEDYLLIECVPLKSQ